MSFRRVSHSECQPGPRPLRIERSRIVPGSEQAEYLAAEGAGKEKIYAIQPPDHRRREIAEHLTTQISSKAGSGAPARVPMVGGIRFEIELFRDRLRERQEKGVRTLEVR